MRKTPLIFFLLLLCIPGFSQELPRTHYQVEDGLPSSELYDVVQDQQGFIWVASDRGVSRFDGYRFTNFTMKDGLTDNTVFNIWPDKKGRTWFNTFNAKLCYYEDGQFKTYKYNDSILKYTRRSRILRTFEIHDDGSILLGYLYGGLLQISASGKVSRLMNNSDNNYVIRADAKTGSFAAGKNFIPGWQSDTLLIKYDLTGNKGEIPCVLKPEFSEMITAYHRLNGDNFFAIGTSLFMCDKNGITNHPLSSPVMRICEDKDSCLWVSTRKGGVYRCRSNAAFSEDAELFFRDEQVSCVYEDNEHGFWIATLKNGLYYVPSMQFRIFPTAGHETTAIAGQGSSNIFLGAKTGEIYSRKNGKWKIIDPLTNTTIPRGELNSMYYDSIRGNLLVDYANNKNIISIDSFGHSSFFVEGYVNDFAANADTVFLSSANGVAYVLDGKLYSLGYESRPEALYCDVSGKLWIAGRPGLSCLAADHIIFPDTAQLLKTKMLCITGFPDGRIVTGTIDKGIIIYDPRTREIKNITQAEGLSGHIVNTVFADKNGSIWAGTNNGLSHIILEGNKTAIQNYGVEAGLPSSEILSVFVSGKEVWATSRKSFIYFRPGEIRPNKIPPPVYFISIHAGDSALETKHVAELNYDQDILRFSFVGLNFRSRGHVRYRYEMEGLDNKSIITSVPEALFLAVPPGEYHFRVWAINEDETQSASPAVFYFIIHPPFWQTAWFRVSLVLFIIAVIVFSVYGIIRRIRKQNRLRENLLEYRQQALTNQMNPHFIFNALNAVQSYIVREDKLSATRYLSRFSRLMRMSLDHSRLKLVPLSQELNLIRVYLELEAMRFGEKLEWSIDIRPELENGNYAVPSMLIQPYIENAIKHGILNREDKTGKVNVRFIMEQDDLRVEVEDNGVGRAFTGNTNAGKDHSPAGTSITENRLLLICHSMKFSFRFRVTDRADENGNPAGTIVIFTLPYLKNTNEN